MNTVKLRNWTTAAAMALAMTLPTAAQQLIALEQVHNMAATANTAAKHAEVAKQYRLHAEALEAKAVEHEKNVAAMSRNTSATVKKWPGMATRQLQTEKQKAVEARRAARQTMALADRHMRLAVEAQANVNPPVNAN
jgi:hypothetical protein